MPTAHRVLDRDSVLEPNRVAVVVPDREWDDYTDSATSGSLGHASAWTRIFAAAYGIDSLHLAARDGDGRICGVLALARFRTLSGTRSWVSLPFLDSAGVLADDVATEAALLDAARALNAPVELRQSAALASAPVGRPPRVELVLPLGGGADARWHALPAKVRNQTRKALKEGLKLAPDDADVLAEFYAVHRHAMRELGSPPHAKAFFAAVLREFGERARCFVVRDGDVPIGGLVAIHFAGAVTVPWASTLARHRSRCPNNLLYWEAIRWAEERGARAFSFGRSPWGSGTHRFKLGWGAVEHPLHWLQLDARGHAVAASPAGDSRPLRLLSRVWRRLPPALCDRCGPHVRRHIAS